MSKISEHNPIISVLYRTFQNFKRELELGKGNNSNRKIRFTFAEIRNDCYQFKIKFTPGFKVIKFMVSRDALAETVECQLLEKTNNIVRDIDEIYRTVDTKYFEIGNLLSRELSDDLNKLFIWGLVEVPQEEDSLHRVLAVEYRNDLLKNKNTLYWGLIEQVDVESRHEDIFGLKLILMNGSIFHIQSHRDRMSAIYPGKLILVNYDERYNLFSFSTAKHHVLFSKRDYASIVDYYVKHEGVRYAA